MASPELNASGYRLEKISPSLSMPSCFSAKILGSPHASSKLNLEAELKEGTIIVGRLNTNVEDPEYWIRVQVVMGKLTNDTLKAILLKSLDLLSRSHFSIALEGGKYLIRDMSSRNGTYLNQTLLEPTLDYELKDGDKIHAAEITFCWRAPKST